MWCFRYLKIEGVFRGAEDGLGEGESYSRKETVETTTQQDALHLFSSLYSL